MAFHAKLVFFLEVFFVGYAFGDCDSPLGMESRSIPDAYITSSSQWDGNHGPTNARLNKPASGGKTGAWSAKTNDIHQWIQVLFPEVTKLSGVAIQGRSDADQWVNKFKVAYSLDGANFITQGKVYDGNNDRDGVAFRTLDLPVVGRAFRIIPIQWHVHISLRMELYGCHMTSVCASPLGMENYRIPNSVLTASSEWDGNHGATNARLNKPNGGGKTGAWSAKENNVNQWLQVTFPNVVKVTAVGIQGRYDADQWVTKFKVAYSSNGAVFVTQDKVYTGDSNRNGIVINDLEQAAQGRAFRIIPVQWHGHISLRMELYGCHLTSECASALGMEKNVIPNSAISASSEWDGNHGATNARLNKPNGGGKFGAWSAKENNVNQWLQVTFPNVVKVTAVGIQGRYDADQWVTKFKVAYSSNGADFVTQDKVYTGNSNRNGIVINDLEHAVQGRAFRIIPVQWHGHISLRMELYGCHLTSECASPLGMENSGIPNSAISASSEWDTKHGPTNARLNRLAGGGKTGAWSAKENDVNQWIQLTFIDDVMKVTAVAIQGRSDADQWVTKLKVSYSADGVNFIRQDKVYHGNYNRNGIVINDLVAPVTARAIRIEPVEWRGHISLRLELYGCHTKPGCSASLGMRNQQIPDSAISASSEWDSNHGPVNARLDRPAGGGKTGAWSAKSNNINQWIQVTFPGNTRVTAVGIQGRYDADQWVTSYRVWTSVDGINFVLLDKVYTGNRDRNSVVVQNLNAPIVARAIRINPVTWQGHISMRMELYGCKAEVIDGGYSNWGSYSECSKTCGGGVETRTRTCTNPPPQHGGKDCSTLGPASATRECNNFECIKNWKAVGCYQNRGRALGDTMRSVGSYRNINRKLDACKETAVQTGIIVFGLDDKRCWSGQDAENTYDDYGSSGQCKANTDGNSMGYFASESVSVYKKNSNGVWENMGCFSNKSPTNALPDLFENNVSSVSGPDAIYDYCKAKAQRLGYNLFGADDENCWSGDDAENTYNKYGVSKECVFSKAGTGHANGQNKYGNVFVYELE